MTYVRFYQLLLQYGLNFLVAMVSVLYGYTKIYKNIRVLGDLTMSVENISLDCFIQVLHDLAVLIKEPTYPVKEANLYLQSANNQKILFNLRSCETPFRKDLLRYEIMCF